MLDIVVSNRFKKDLKLAIRRGYRMDLREEVVNTLAANEKLAPKYKDHELTGNYNGLRECHITPDWLLVYQIIDNELVLYLARTGTHSDLF